MCYYFKIFQGKVLPHSLQLHLFSLTEQTLEKKQHPRSYDCFTVNCYYQLSLVQISQAQLLKVAFYNVAGRQEHLGHLAWDLLFVLLFDQSLVVSQSAIVEVQQQPNNEAEMIKFQGSSSCCHCQSNALLYQMQTLLALLVVKKSVHLLRQLQMHF